MPKVYIETDEAYPVFSITEDPKWASGQIDLTEEEVKLIQRAEKNYEKAQAIISRKLDELKEKEETPND